MISSFIPGRVRLRDARFKDEEFLSAVLPLIKGEEAVTEVRANPFTGSLLIHYDPAKLDPEAIAKALEFLSPPPAEDREEALADEAGEGGNQLGENLALAILHNKSALEFTALLGAFVVCLSSGFLRQRNLHVYSGLTLAGLTVEHLVKHRRRLMACLFKPKKQPAA